MTSPVKVEVKRLPHGGGLPLPAYATSGAAGMDVVSAESVTIAPGARHAVATGLALAIPAGYEIQVRPRSGLALKHGITVPNTPGTIDSDYRGELKVILINLGTEPFAIARGEEDLVNEPVYWVRREPNSGKYFLAYDNFVYPRDMRRYVTRHSMLRVRAL